VAVLASSGTAGDALDDAFFVLGPERSRGYLTRLHDTEAIFFLPTSAHTKPERASAGQAKAPKARQRPDAGPGWTVVHERSQ
jgi:thiamine biosynthesis lipoprotein ApbE